MAFGRIKNSGKKVIASQGPVSNFYQTTLAMEEGYKYDKEPILRPSGFPICPINTMVRIRQYNEYNYIPDICSIHSDYFTSVGTTTHEVVQNWMAKTGKMLADWQCLNPDCSNHSKDPENLKLVRQVGNICKKCEHPMLYHEIEVEYDIITGHVDAILRLRKGAYWAADYKTSSMKKLEKLKEPSLNYFYQISSYAWILKYEYEVPIEGFSIFYIVRDNPSVFKEFPFDFDKKMEKKAKSIIDQEIVKYKAAKRAVKTDDIKHAIKEKPCKNKDDYARLMGEYCKCEFVDHCFGNKLETEVRKKLDTI